MCNGLNCQRQPVAQKSVNHESKVCDVSELLSVPAARLYATVRDLVDGGTGWLEVHQGLAVRGVVNLGVGDGGGGCLRDTYITLDHEGHPVTVPFELCLVTDHFLWT